MAFEVLNPSSIMYIVVTRSFCSYTLIINSSPTSSPFTNSSFYYDVAATLLSSILFNSFSDLHIHFDCLSLTISFLFPTLLFHLSFTQCLLFYRRNQIGTQVVKLHCIGQGSISLRFILLRINYPPTQEVTQYRDLPLSKCYGVGLEEYSG